MPQNLTNEKSLVQVMAWCHQGTSHYCNQCGQSSLISYCIPMPQWPRLPSSWGQHGAHLGPVGPRWAPCWPHEPCFQRSSHIEACMKWQTFWRWHFQKHFTEWMIYILNQISVKFDLKCLTDNMPTFLGNFNFIFNINGLVQKRCKSIANALGLRLSCTNPSICAFSMPLSRSLLIFCDWKSNFVFLYDEITFAPHSSTSMGLMTYFA